MAFYNNQEDMILDAVLTDVGRLRLAQGNFKIVQFACGDTDINYQQYSAPAIDPASLINDGPVLEASTDSDSCQRSKLITFANNNYSYLPTSAIVTSQYGGNNEATGINAGYRALLTTEAAYNKFPGALPAGVQKCYNLGEYANAGISLAGVSMDFGFLAASIPTLQRGSKTISNELKEHSFLIQMDDKYLQLFVPGAGVTNNLPGGKVSTANIAPSMGKDSFDVRSYLINDPADSRFFQTVADDTTSPILGAFTANRCLIRPGPSAWLQTIDWGELVANYSVQTLANWFADTSGVGTVTGDAYAIDTPVTITGMTTGIQETFYIRLIREVPGT